VLDPFGGVGLGACDALQQGLRWLGVELEPRFVALAHGFACDGSIVEALRSTFHPAQPATLEYFVSDGVQQWGPGGLYTSGDAGFASHAEAQAWIAAQPTIAYTGLLILKVGGPATPATLDFAWQTVTPAACGRKDAHAPHHVTGNLELWQRRYGHLPQYVAPTLLQGDSRRLGAVLREQVSACVSSPPFGTEQSGGGIAKDGYSSTPGSGHLPQTHYGDTPGQLAALPPGSLDACLASPPFSSVMPSNAAATWHQKRESIGEHNSLGRSPTYGTSPAQLGNLPAGTVEAVVSSPPWEDQLVNHDTPANYAALKAKCLRDGHTHAGRPWSGASYGEESPGQLGTEHGTTFWEAAREIIAQVVALLKSPGQPVPDGEGIEFCSCK